MPKVAFTPVILDHIDLHCTLLFALPLRARGQLHFYKENIGSNFVGLLAGIFYIWPKGVRYWSKSKVSESSLA